MGSYERAAIEDWLTRFNVSPVTSRPMLPSDLTVNRRVFFDQCCLTSV